MEKEKRDKGDELAEQQNLLEQGRELISAFTMK
jgi:hypothetical protein